MAGGESQSKNEQAVREYFEIVDGRSDTDLREIFAADVELSVPRFGTVRGVEFLARMVSALRMDSIHHVDQMTVRQVDQVFVVEGTTEGVTSNGRTWDGRTGWSGRFCNVFEVEGGRITRMAVYLDPDFGSTDLPVPTDWPGSQTAAPPSARA